MENVTEAIGSTSKFETSFLPGRAARSERSSSRALPRLPGINPQDAVRALPKAGFRIARQSGHVIMTDGSRIVVVPRANPITMGSIIADAGLSTDEFRKLLK